FRNFFKPNKAKSKTTYDEIVHSILGIIQLTLSNENIKLIEDLNCKDSFTTHTVELKQVILNLIKNAEEALLGNGVKDPTIKIVTYTEENNYILEVRDNAGGVPKDIIDNIFDPYFSTKKNKDGSGLGLYMSKTIIEEHCEGTLSVSNDKNGAIFKIVLSKIDIGV
ncbi:MAG: HAMP domain-containing histidine kinase, partial [Bacteroidales bacterium]|nr:HAMP domain-containing histidine kinase [Bacteroidales bacterium]